MEKTFSVAKREHFTVLIRVKLNWRHRQRLTHSLAYSPSAGRARHPLCFPFRLIFLLYTGTGNVAQYF